MRGDGAGAMPCQEAQELDCLSVEPAASLGAEDEKAASSGAAEFGVSAVTLAPGSSIVCAAWQGVCAGAGFASLKGGPDCCVKGELGPVQQGETIGDDLDAPFISDRHVEVHVCQPDSGRPWHRLRGKRARRHAREAAHASTAAQLCMYHVAHVPDPIIPHPSVASRLGCALVRVLA